MSTRTIYVSDISGEPEAQRATLGYDGEWHEIDLSPVELKALTTTLEPYLEAGRRLGRTLDAAHKPVVPETTPEEREEIRAWGRENGFEFAERGRIPKKLQRAYDDVHGIERSFVQ